MSVRKIKKNIYSVGVEDYDRRLFDSLIPLPDGTSYNSYLINGAQKTVLIDTVNPDKKDQFLRNLDDTGVGKIDYIVANHAEQDHSGTLGVILEKHPEATVLASEKCKDLLVEFGLAS
nr:MBL fold metallo-hydrolase [Elusimicrobiota bacterium]